MTFEQINNLQISDVEYELAFRLSNPDTVIDAEYLDSFDFTTQAVLDEFVIYKNELTVIEQARLDEIQRIQYIEDRFDALDDFRTALFSIGRYDPNIAILKLSIIKTNDTTLLSQIENADASEKASRLAAQYIEDRKVEYKKIDDSLMEALVEKELGDSTKWDAYVVARDTIKSNNPKPV